MDKRIFINADDPEEVRIAITIDGKLEEVYIERANAETYLGNIYKGVVTNVEPSIGAAFVDFGGDRNGFLHASDVLPMYRYNNSQLADQNGKDDLKKHEKRNIQEYLMKGQEVLVQVTKDGIGKKGPTLTTYLSIPGRYLVLMPSLSRSGVSKKIEDREERGAPEAAARADRSAAGHGLHHPDRRHRPERGRAPQGPRVPAEALEHDRRPRARGSRAEPRLPRVRHRHPHDPRRLHAGRRRGRDRQRGRLQAGARVPAGRHGTTARSA